MNHEKLYVIAVISNPKRFESRYRLYRKFAKYMESFPNVILYTAELAFNNRPFEITEANNPRHIQLRTKFELWHKENLINIVARRLPCDWTKMATIDADVRWANENWAEETLQALEHHPIVQMFSEAVDLSPVNTIINQAESFVYKRKVNPVHVSPEIYEGVHAGRTGFAWAYTREAFEKIGGLIDFAILGSGDWYMAHGLFGCNEDSLRGHVGDHCPEYANKILAWQRNAVEQIKMDVGYVPGLLLHDWHGKKSDRGYGDRNRYLVNNHFTPSKDLRYDSQGLLELTSSNPGLRDGLRDYFNSRNEDSIDYK